MYEHDLKKRDIVKLLKLAGVSQNSRREDEYNRAKRLLENEWNDTVAREVSRYVGV